MVAPRPAVGGALSVASRAIGAGIFAAVRRYIPLVALLGAACATTQAARPVGRGNTRISASLGGPLVQFGGAPVPLPITTVGVAHGVSDFVDVHGEVHPTAALFGIAGLSGGVALHPLSSHRGALTFGASLNAFGNPSDGVLFADLWVAGGGHAASWLWLGGGLHNGLRLAGTGSINEQTPWAPTVFGLASFLVSRRVALNVEARWYAVASCGGCVAPDYYPLGDRGALGVLLGVDYQFGGGAR